MDKPTLREQLHTADPPRPEIAAAVVDRLFEFLAPRLPGTVAGFLSMHDEIDVSPLFGRLPGWNWVLPRVEANGSLTLRDREVEYERHRWGMYQPVDSGSVTPPAKLDLVLVPGLAFDNTGSRLGRGTAYYDRLLVETRPDCLAIGVTWAERVIPLVPTEPHDRPMDYLATEDGVKKCAPRR